MNKKPEQTARTRQKIIDSFWEITKSHSLNKINVRMITEKCNINRSTFYEYFCDINQLISEVEDELLNELKSQVLIKLTVEDSKDYYAFFQQLIMLLINLGDKMLFLLGKRGDPHFLSKLRNQLINYHVPPQLNPELALYNDFLAAYITSSTIGLITYWDETGRKITPEELGNILFNISTKGFFDLSVSPKEYLGER